MTDDSLQAHRVAATNSIYLALPKVMADVQEELRRQDEKWGHDRHNPVRTWITVLGEEFGEICRGDLECEPVRSQLEEWIQVAAVAVAAASDIRRMNGMALAEPWDPKPWEIYPLPPARYSCAVGDCALDQTFPIEEMYVEPVYQPPNTVHISIYCKGHKPDGCVPLWGNDDPLLAGASIEPSYPCANGECGLVFPADMLSFHRACEAEWDKLPEGWVCENCLDHHNCWTVNLQREMDRRGAN